MSKVHCMKSLFSKKVHFISCLRQFSFSKLPFQSALLVRPRWRYCNYRFGRKVNSNLQKNSYRSPNLLVFSFWKFLEKKRSEFENVKINTQLKITKLILSEQKEKRFKIDYHSGVSNMFYSRTPILCGKN